MRTPAQVQTELLQILPDGWAMPEGDPDTYYAASLLPMATEWSAIEASMESFQQELDPGTAENLLPEYLGVLSDPYGWNELPLPAAQIAALAHARWVDAPIICAGYFISVAAAIGITITIEEFPLSLCGEAVCGEIPVPWLQHLVFQVTLPTDDSWDEICGDGVCGDTLGGFTPSVMEPFINDKAPLWTRAVFSYSGS